MNVYIQTDIEGVAGVVFFDNRMDPSHEGFSHRQRMRRLLTREINAAAVAAFECGAKTVLINDNHGTGYNIFFEELDPRCEIIHGRNGSGTGWMPELDSSFDAMLLIGMHAMSGTPNANLQHTKWVINKGEYYLSEATMAAALAGDYGVPTVFISGDNYVVQETREKIPGIKSAVVKKSLGVYMARSRCPGAVAEMIHANVTAGLQERSTIEPFAIPGPVTINLLESKKGNHDQREGFEYTTADVTADNLVTAFSKSINQFPWFPGQISVPDGFEYP